jgi:voltage-gated hydrogen channel 1
MNCCKIEKDTKEIHDLLEEELTIRRLLFSHGLVWDPNISTRAKSKLILRSNLFHIIVIILVIIDVICVAAELTLMVERGKSVHDDMDTAEKVLKYISLSILSIFMIEITIKIIVLRKEILKSIGEIFDIIIVVVSFVLDLVFIFYHDMSKFPIELLAVLRLWRIIRIVNSE